MACCSALCLLPLQHTAAAAAVVLLVFQLFKELGVAASAVAGWLSRLLHGCAAAAPLLPLLWSVLHTAVAASENSRCPSRR
jgi:hypothetical protein